MEKLEISTNLMAFIQNSSVVCVNKKNYHIDFSNYSYYNKNGENSYYETTNKNIVKVGQPKRYFFDESDNWVYADICGKEKPTKIKIGKFIKKLDIVIRICDNSYSSRSITDEKIINKVINRWSDMLNDNLIAMREPLTDIKISKNVSSIYAIPTYMEKESGFFVFESCMSPYMNDITGKVIHDSLYRSIYDNVFIFDYIDNLSIVYGTKDDRLFYRALLWDVEIDGVKTKFLDRVYGNRIVTGQLITWAKKNNYAYYSPHHCGGVMYKDQENIILTFKIERNDDFFRVNEEEGSIYLDTFNIYSPKRGMLSNKIRSFSDTPVLYLNESDGSAINTMVYCYECKREQYVYDIIDYGVTYENKNFCDHCKKLVGEKQLEENATIF